MALPNVHFAETDARVIEAAIIIGFEKAAQNAGQADFKLYPGDPRRLFLEALALYIVQQNAVIDKTGKGNLLRYAGEDTIEDIGWLYGTRGARLEPSAALTTIQFTLSTPRPTVTTIAAGTKLSAGNLIFTTNEDLNIPINTLTGTVEARCTETGPIGNGLLPGQISSIISRNPFVASAINITESAGGSTLEDLEAYRLRIRSAPESFSVAGPDGAYEFWAKTAHQSIADVAVWSPKPAHVNVVPLLAGGNMPTQEIMDAVHAILSDKKKRPLTDYVHVLAPEAVPYDIALTYWIGQDEATNATAIQGNVDAAVEEYKLWQRGKLKRDIIPSELHRRVMNAGARRVEINAPVFTVLELGQVAQEHSVNVTYGGLERA